MMKSLSTTRILMVAMLGAVAGASVRARSSLPQRADVVTVSDTPTVAAALAQAGYVGVPLHPHGNDRVMRATIGTTAVALRLESGAPYDLFLDSAFHFGGESGVHATGVLSAYWTLWTNDGPEWHWAFVDRLTAGAATLAALEAKVEPAPDTGTRARLGATALMSWGAIIDYATDTLYVLAPHETPSPAGGAATRWPTLRAALEQAGHYRTFLALMQKAGLMSLLDSTSRRKVVPDSVAWLGLRIGAAERSAVGHMFPNDVHLQLTRAALDREFRRPGRHTVFAPTDAAFEHVPADTLRAWRADTAHLARLLRAHLFPGVAIDTAGMRTLIRGAAQPGDAHPAFGFHVLGSRIDVDRLTSWEAGRVVGRATIVDPDLRAANGIAHGIDRILDTLTTPSPLADALRQRGYVGIPLVRREDGNGYAVQATVNGVPARLTVATGAPLDVALDRQWSSRLKPASGSSYAVAVGAVNLGSIAVKAVDLSGSMDAAQHLGYRADVGVVGSILLSKYQALVDYAAGMLYLRIPKSP